MSRRAFQQRLPVAKYGPFREMYWDNDLDARPEDSVETEPPKEQPLQLTPEELTVEIENNTPQPIPPTEKIDYYPAQPEDRTYVDADAEVTEPEEHSMDPYV